MPWNNNMMKPYEAKILTYNDALVLLADCNNTRTSLSWLDDCIAGPFIQ